MPSLETWKLSKHAKLQRILPVYATAKIIKDLEVLGVDRVGAMAVFVRFLRKETQILGNKIVVVMSWLDKILLIANPTTHHAGGSYFHSWLQSWRLLLPSPLVGWHPARQIFAHV